MVVGSEKKILGMEHNIFFAGLTSFLTDTSTKMVYAVMPLFLLSIGASKTQLSLIEGIAESTASLLKAFSGWWSDKIGKNKPFMLFGYVITAMITPIYSLVMGPIQVLYLRFIERVGKGIRTAPRDSLIAGSTDGNRTGKSFGFHKAMDNAGAIIGPLLAVWIMMVFADNYRLVFLLAAIPAVLGVIVILSFIREAGKAKENLPKKIVFRNFSKRFYAFLFIAFIFTLGNSTDALLLVKAKDSGFSDIYIPLLYLVFNIVSVIFAIPIGMLSDKIGREKLIIFGYLLYSAIYFCFGSFRMHFVIIMLFALYGLYSASTDGVQKALVSDLIDPDKRGTGLGLYNAVLGITLLPASLIAGILYDKAGPGMPFYFGSAMSFAAAVLMMLFYGKKLMENKSMEGKKGI